VGEHQLPGPGAAGPFGKRPATDAPPAAEVAAVFYARSTPAIGRQFAAHNMPVIPATKHTKARVQQELYARFGYWAAFGAEIYSKDAKNGPLKSLG